ncbi:MAG TPA: hypothetical protein VL093_08720 [Flavipsychrobacter sp.]|jgi:hypothetical protein|nr:hypothetical protein [Flavipsychrobacter sp.]
MKTTESQIRRENINGSFIEDKKAIENFGKVASYLEIAAKEYRHAASYHVALKHDLAFRSIITAQGNELLAKSCKEEILIHYALNS